MGKDKSQKTISLKLARTQTDGSTRFETYEVPFTKTMRVLDAIKWVKNNKDGTLAYRWNCGMGICGSCAMEVNGVPVLTCKTELKSSIFPITISPLRAFPVVKDLVADYSGIYEKEKKLHLWFEGKVKGEFLQFSDEEAEIAAKFRSCIECMICVGNCKPMVEAKTNFIGPKSVVKVVAYDFHPKDELDRSKLLQEQGLFHCAQTRCCQNNCPQDIPITDKGILPEQSQAKKNP